jgi:hypothetical protein
MNRRALLAVFVIVAAVSGGVAQAGPIVIQSASVGGAPTGVFYDNLNWVSNTQSVTQVSPVTGIEITLYPDAQAVTGSVVNVYAAPYIYSSNGVLFGDNTAEGADATKYLTTGSTNAAAGAMITIKFQVQQTYMGLLWGSVDTYNTLKFYLNGVEQASFTGANVTPSATGNQGKDGTFYVNFGGGPFDEVRATSSQKAFEFDNIALQSVPDGGATLMLLGGALAAVAALKRFRG